MPLRIYKRIGARISRVKNKRKVEEEKATKVVVVPEVRTVPVRASVTEIKLGAGPTVAPPSTETAQQPPTAPPTQAQPVPVPVPMPMSPSPQVVERRSVLREKYEAVPLKIVEKELPPLGKEEELLEKLQSVNEKYPLITIQYKGRKIIAAWANIRWEPRIHSLLYLVHEPLLTREESEKLSEIKALLREKLDIDFSKVKLESAYKYLMEKFNSISKELGIKLKEKQKLKFQYYLYRDFIGLGKIEPLMHDKNIEDISCDGVNIPVFIYHRNPLYGQLRTNIVFKTKEELDSFVLKLAQKCGRTLTIAQPLLDGALPDGSRVQATLGTDIARRGSNFTIRKFPENPFTPVDLINYGTASPELMAYLWLCIENGLSILIAGATATGKTSFLNALSLFIKPEMKVISIEDTPELQLPHPNWIPEVARVGFGVKGYGEVSMFDLLKAALRQRPDYVIVGEVRGAEAYVMFQGMATGHPGLGTLHADSLPAVIDRLTTKPINLPMAMLENLDIIVFLILTKRKGHYIRRVSEVVEIIGYDYTLKDLITNVAFRWDPQTDTFVLLKSVLLDKIRERMGMSIDELKHELVRRAKVLRWMVKNNLSDYRRFARVIAAYYANPKLVEDMMGGEV